MVAGPRTKMNEIEMKKPTALMRISLVRISLARVFSGHRLALGALALAGALGAHPAVAGSDTPTELYSGRSSQYQNLSSDSLEYLSSADTIRSVTMPNVAPTRIWQVLEHGEKVECLDCIPGVAKLLYHSDARAREISAWWLRRRVFGVFGPGQVYSKVVATLQDASAPETQRAYAAEAIGEFLTFAGVKYVARASIQDESALVREASVRALARLNSEGPNGELGAAMADSSEQVRMSALRGALKVNVFTDVDAVVARISDPSSSVRKLAAEALGVMRAEDAVMGLLALTRTDVEAEPRVRASAVHALGQIADPQVRRDLETVRDTDPNQFVVDAATIALRRL